MTVAPDFSAMVCGQPGAILEHAIGEFSKMLAPDRMFLCSRESAPSSFRGQQLRFETALHGQALQECLKLCKTRYLIVLLHPAQVTLDKNYCAQVESALQQSSAAIAYSAYFMKRGAGSGPGTVQPLIEYQEGSVRDDFDFGHLAVLDMERVRSALQQHTYVLPPNASGWYGLRLVASLAAPPLRMAQPLYTALIAKEEDSEQVHFQYVQQDRASVQRQMEETFTTFAQLAGFHLPPVTKKESYAESGFLLEASVVIPVKDRVQTIQESVDSALSQKTRFAFNVIVIDNHSQDGTSEKLIEMASRRPGLIHVIPPFTSLGIGGCWNEAIFHPRAGRFCVQLDSDDLYSDSGVLQRIIDTFHAEQCAAVVGSYRVVNTELHEIPPGVVAHREWTEENGHNNALRVNGFGAPRAFYTPLIRQVRFPNVSYGEDYSVMLAISREHRVARIYDVIYNCRRWAGNSDANPSIELLNAHNFYKDSVRTQEIQKRRKLVQR